MKTSPPGVALIKEFEGFPNHGCPYRDPVGVWTRGYGRIEGITRHSPCISEPEASRELSALLASDYEPAVNKAASRYRITLAQPAFDATVSFVYNLGVGMLDASHTFGEKLKAKDLKGAAESMLLYDKAGGRALPGLTRRRKAERAMFLSGLSSDPLPASRFNAPGQHHNDVYCAPKASGTYLWYPNGTATGGYIDRSTLFYPGHEGKIQLDNKEIVVVDRKRYYFARGGYIADHDPIPYGHVWIGDLAEGPGNPVPSGGGRGAPAPRTRLVTLQVQAIPDEMGYKTSGGSRWASYGDAGAKYGAVGQYSYMTWSCVSDGTGTVPGGGIVRALVPHGGHIWLTNVKRIRGPSYDLNGNPNGFVDSAYCERSGLFGWVVVAHQYRDEALAHHIV